MPNVMFQRVMAAPSVLVERGGFSRLRCTNSVAGDRRRRCAAKSCLCTHGDGSRSDGNNRGSRESFLVDSSHRSAMAKRIRKEQEMKGLVLSIGAIVAALSLAYGLGVASASSSAARAGTKVAVASSKLGRILVDKHGRT